jgi:glutamyl/glutaminyl-tRNA synthetase
MNTNEASLGRSTVQTYSSREKRAFDGVLFSMECTARWLENASDPMQAAAEIRLAMAELRNCIADCEVIADAGSRQEEVEHIASVYEDKDGTKYVQFDIEDAEDIPVGTKLYPVARTLTRREIEEIAGYVEDECKACSGMTTLYIAAEAAVEETLRRIASPVPAQYAEQDERAAFDAWCKSIPANRSIGPWEIWQAARAASTQSTATQPVQTQVALTDEQIDMLGFMCATETGPGSYKFSKGALLDFARAILAAQPAQ